MMGGGSAVSRLGARLGQIEMRPKIGLVTKAVGLMIHAVMPQVRIGELCVVRDPVTGWQLDTEVVGFSEGGALLTPLGELQGLPAGAEVHPTGRMMGIDVGDGLLGRVVDANGVPIDNLGPIAGPRVRLDLQRPSPPPMSRPVLSRPLPLGLRSLDALITCAEGQRIGIFGEPGGGKSSLLAQIVRCAEIDVAVIALIGERGREVREFIEHNLGAAGLARSVVVAATSDRPAVERLKAGYAATTIAEHFRDQGRRVLLIMDSVTRFARAQRDVGLAAGEPPTRRGFPPSVFAVLPRLLERSGATERGSITGLYSVLVEGDGQGDPVAEETRSILDGHIVLSRKLASSGHYPAIDVLASRSRVADAVIEPEHKRQANRFRELLAKYDEVEFLIQVGEYKTGSNPVTDEAVAKIEYLRAFLRQGSTEKTSFQEMRQWMHHLIG